MLNRMISKKTRIFIFLMPLWVVGCSNQDANRETDGGDGYLNSPALVPLATPEGIKLPKENYDYGIYKNQNMGVSGKNLDVRPPLLPAPTTENSYASYRNRVVSSDIPAGTGFWNSIPSTLEKMDIPIINYNNNIIQTGEANIRRTPNEQSVEASFVIKRQNDNGREKITIELIKLTKKGRVIVDPIEVQYYVVNLYNQLMEAIAPIPDPKSVKPAKIEEEERPEIKGIDATSENNQE